MYGCGEIREPVAHRQGGRELLQVRRGAHGVGNSVRGGAGVPAARGVGEVAARHRQQARLGRMGADAREVESAGRGAALALLLTGVAPMAACALAFALLGLA